MHDSTQNIKTAPPPTKKFTKPQTKIPSPDTQVAQRQTVNLHTIRLLTFLLTISCFNYIANRVIIIRMQDKVETE